MAAKKVRIDLDPQGPITFERVVQIPTPDGKGIGLPVTYLYRDREAIAKWQQGHGSRIEAAVGGDEPADMVAVAQRITENDADVIMDVITDWGVEDTPLTRENVIKFLRLYQGAALTILLDYRKSCIEGRLGN